MRRRTPRSSEHPDLFASSASTWAARHWPSYAAGGVPEEAHSPLEQWAAAVEGLSPGAMQLLQLLAGAATASGRASCTIADLAKASESSQNATRARIDRLLTAGILLVRPRTGPRPCGYEFQVVATEEQLESARATGFTAKRLARPVRRERAHG